MTLHLHNVDSVDADAAGRRHLLGDNGDLASNVKNQVRWI